MLECRKTLRTERLFACQFPWGNFAAKGLHGLDVCVDLGTSFEHGPVVLALGDLICLATVHSCRGQGWQEGQLGGYGG